MSRLETYLAETLAIYGREPPEARAGLEAALRGARDSLIGADRISSATKDRLKDTFEMIALEGFLKTGGWVKVHRALKAAAPALYEELVATGVLPRVSGDPNLPW